MKKKFFWQNSKSWFVYFTETEKAHSGNGLKIIKYIQTWPSDVKKFKKECRTRTWVCRHMSILVFFEQYLFQLNHSASLAFADVSALLATMMIILPRNIDDETCAKTQISTTYRTFYHSCHTLNWPRLSNLGKQSF